MKQTGDTREPVGAMDKRAHLTPGGPMRRSMSAEALGACLNLYHQQRKSNNCDEYPGHRAMDEVLILFRGQEVVNQEGQPPAFGGMLYQWFSKCIQPDNKPSDNG